MKHTLWEISLCRDGLAPISLAVVRSKTAQKGDEGYNSVYSEIEKAWLVPDLSEVEWTLPHPYRKAWRRQMAKARPMSYPSHGHQYANGLQYPPVIGCTAPLISVKRARLATVSAVPYVFDSTPRPALSDLIGVLRE